MKTNIFVSLVLAGALFVPLGAVAQCVGLTEESADYDLSPKAQAIHGKKIEYARSVISTGEFIKSSPECVAKALGFLGQFHVQEAIPRMVELLTFEHKVSNPISVRTRNQEYPAIGGLAGMGKPAVPALLAAASSSKGDPVVVENVMYAVMTIYSAHPGDGIGILQNAADHEQDSLVAVRLRDAIAEARSIWCKDLSKCIDQSN